MKTFAARPAPIPRQRIADDAAALIASKYGAEPSPEAWEIGQELEAGQTFLRRGLSSDILKKLRRGHWSVQSEIDLHGHTIFEAHDALSDFLDDARAHGYRCVRVIHGKGLTSPNREPVLKSKVRRWLSQWDEVLAYCEAPRHGGGGGAVLILAVIRDAAEVTSFRERDRRSTPGFRFRTAKSCGDCRSASGPAPEQIHRRHAHHDFFALIQCLDRGAHQAAVRLRARRRASTR